MKVSPHIKNSDQLL